MKQALGIDVTLVRGHSGVFAVEVDGVVVLSKGRTGFPTEDQIIQAVAGALDRERSPG